VRDALVGFDVFGLTVDGATREGLDRIVGDRSVLAL